MLKRLPLYILLFFIVSCSYNSGDSHERTIELVAELQKKAKNNDINALKYLDSVDQILLSTKNLPDTLRVENLYRRAIYYRGLKKRDSAAKYFHRVIDLIDSTYQNDRVLSYYRQTWNNDIKMGNEANAIAIAQRLILVSKNKEDFKNQYYAYNLLARMYQRLNETDKQLAHNELAIQMAIRSNDSLNEIMEIGYRVQTLAQTRRTKEALEILDGYVQNANENPHQINAALFLSYGFVQFFATDYEGSIESYKRALKHSKEQKSEAFRNYDISTAYGNIGESYRELGQRDLEKKYLDSAESFALKSNDHGQIMYIYDQQIKTKYDSHPIALDMKSSFDSLVRFQSRNYTRKINADLEQLRISNEKERELIAQKQQAEIARIKFRNKVTVSGILVSVLALISYILYQRKQFKNARQRLQMQQRLLRSQMNPHFTFNTLSTIENQIQTAPKEASNYLIKFSRLLRLILENSTSNYILLEKEIESLKKYMDLQKLRFPDKFDYTFVYDNMEEDAFIFIPPMLIQPFVENSIEHGFSGIDYQGDICVSLSRKQKYIQCTITDNGTGIEDSGTRKKESYSTRLISSFLKDATKSKLNILNIGDIDSAQNGVRVQFLIPFKLTDND